MKNYIYTLHKYYKKLFYFTFKQSSYLVNIKCKNIVNISRVETGVANVIINVAAW